MEISIYEIVINNKRIKNRMVMHSFLGGSKNHREMAQARDSVSRIKFRKNKRGKWELAAYQGFRII